MTVPPALPAPVVPLQAAGVLEAPLGQLLVLVVVLAALVLVGRVVLHVAWRLLLVAGVVVAALYVVSLAVP